MHGWNCSQTRSLWPVQEDMLSCRARATEAVGIIAHAVGLEEASGHLQRCLVAAIEVQFPTPCGTPEPHTNTCNACDHRICIFTTSCLCRHLDVGHVL